MHNVRSEEDLLRLLHTGDEKAFTEIYNLYWKKLYFLAYKHLKTSQAAEEVVQEVFLRLWKKRNDIQIQSLPPYLAAMVRYAVYEQLARESKMPQTGLDGEIQETADISSPDETIDNKYLLGIIEKLSGRLPEQCRLVFIHNKLLDKSLPQVARQLDISDKTAEAHLTKALKIIRGNLRKSLFLFFTI